MRTEVRARLGINNCFAVKRWPRPDDWAAIVAEDLGLDTVELSLDLLDGLDTLGATAVGGHVGSLSVADSADPARRAQRWTGLRHHLAELAAYAHQCGLDH